MAQVISSKNSNCDAEMVRVEVDAGSDTALEGGPRPGIGDGGARGSEGDVIDVGLPATATETPAGRAVGISQQADARSFCSIFADRSEDGGAGSGRRGGEGAPGGSGVQQHRIPGVTAEKSVATHVQPPSPQHSSTSNGKNLPASQAPTRYPEAPNAQTRFLRETQDAFKLSNKYPSKESFMIYPPDGRMGDTTSTGVDPGIDGEDSSRRPIFVWRPEVAFPDAFEGGRPPCPRCKTSKDVISKGWMQHGSRVATLRNGFCDLTTYWYQCRKCQGYNKSKCRGERVPEAFKGWDAGVLAQLPLHIQAMFPFVLRTKSALHVDIASRESRS